VSKRRTVNITGGRWAGRTGTILRMDDSHYYVKVDGGTSARSNGTAHKGCAVEDWVRKGDCVRTGDTPRKEKPRYGFQVMVGVRAGGGMELAQIPGNYPVFEFMEKMNADRVVVEWTHGTLTYTRLITP